MMIKMRYLANKKFITLYYLGVVAIYFFHAAYGERGQDTTIDHYGVVESLFGYVTVRDSLYVGVIHLLVLPLIFIKEKYGRILVCIISGIKVLLAGVMLIPYLGSMVAFGLHLGLCHVFRSFFPLDTYGYYLYFIPLFIFHVLSFRENMRARRKL